MAERLLQLDDINLTNSPAKVTELFRKLGYNAVGQTIDIGVLDLPSRSANVVCLAFNFRRLHRMIGRKIISPTGF